MKLYTWSLELEIVLMFPGTLSGECIEFRITQPECLSFWIVVLPRYDLDSGIKVSVGNHDDSATCVEYSAETCKILITL